MKYYKVESDGYILGIGVDIGGTEIDEKEYAHIKKVIDTQYSEAAKADKWYRLRKDLTWEEIDPPKPEETKDGE